MADRYSNRPFPADDYGRGSDPHGSGAGESDPLAELARLIGQTDPFASTARPASPPPRAPIPRAPYQPPPQYQAPVEQEEEAPAPAGPPSWMQRSNIQRQAVQEPPRAPALEYPEDEEEGDYHPAPVHPLHRYAAAQPAAHHDDYQQDYEQAEDQADPSRYDDALYGQLESGAQDFQREPAFPDDPYAYQDGYEEEPEESPKRRGVLTVAAVLVLAVVGTGAAFAYRTYFGSARSGEPPIIKADNSPTKIVPAQSDSGKAPDRLPAGDGTEKLVPREEAPVDVNARAAGPRVVFPPLNANNNPPTAASVATNSMPAAVPGAAPLNNGTMPNSEPRKIKTFSVRGDQADPSAVPAVPAAPPPSAKPTGATRSVAPAMRSAAPAGPNAPLSLSPDSAQASVPPPEPRTRMAATTPTQLPSASDSAPAGEGRFLVSITSQASEAEAQASFRAMQRKYPDQLGSRTPVIKRSDDKGVVHYRAMVGPFASRDEAARFCTSYKSAGGQCWIP